MIESWGLQMIDTEWWVARNGEIVRVKTDQKFEPRFLVYAKHGVYRVNSRGYYKGPNDSHPYDLVEKQED